MYSLRQSIKWKYNERKILVEAEDTLSCSRMNINFNSKSENNETDLNFVYFLDLIFGTTAKILHLSNKSAIVFQYDIKDFIPDWNQKLVRLLKKDYLKNTLLLLSEIAHNINRKREKNRTFKFSQEDNFCTLKFEAKQQKNNKRFFFKKHTSTYLFTCLILPLSLLLLLLLSLLPISTRSTVLLLLLQNVTQQCLIQVVWPY